MREIPESGRRPASSRLSFGTRSGRSPGRNGRLRGLGEPQAALSISPGPQGQPALECSEDQPRALAKTGLHGGWGRSPRIRAYPSVKGTLNPESAGWGSEPTSAS